MKVVNRLKIKPIKSGLSESQAESIAVSAFVFLAGEPEYFSRFADMTGLDLADIAEISGSRDFLTAVLAYLLTDDSLLLVFCQNNNMQPENINTAHTVLGGEHACN